MIPYYEDGAVTIYHADWRDVRPEADVLVTDPPFGIAYDTSRARVVGSARSIAGDLDTTERDDLLAWWGSKPALVFGSWKVQRPAATHTRLIWDTKGALGMGDLSVPWKPSDQEIYVLGRGFAGPRTTNVLRVAPVQSKGRRHPHEKPVPLMRMLVDKCPAGVIFDPFMGSGSTLVAAAEAGRRVVGCDVDEGYCEKAARRLGQGVLL